MRKSLIMIIFLIGVLILSSKVSLAWWNSSWQYRIPINITEQSGQNLTDYQVRIDLNSSNFDFSKANSDGSDIRFTWHIYELPITITEQSGQDLTDYQVLITITDTEILSKMKSDAGDIRFFEQQVDDPYTETTGKLPYWIESKTDTELKVWVKLNLTANEEKTIYMYYGNPSATSESNLTKVFGTNLKGFYPTDESTNCTDVVNGYSCTVYGDASLEKSLSYDYDLNVVNDSFITLARSSDGLTTDGNYIYEAYDEWLSKYDLNGNLIENTTNARCGYDLKFGGLFYKDGYLWGVIGAYTSPYQAVVVKIDPDTLNCVWSKNVSESLTYSANAIFYLDGYWFLGETASNTGVTKSIVRFDDSWNKIDVAYSETLDDYGYQGATVYAGKVFVTEHDGDLDVFKWDGTKLVRINQKSTNYSEGITYIGNKTFLAFNVSSLKIEKFEIMNESYEERSYYKFDGNGDYIDLGDNYDIENWNDITMCFWYKFDSFDDGVQYIGGFEKSSGARYVFACAFYDNYAETNGLTDPVQCFAEDSAEAQDRMDFNNMKNTNWHFICLQYGSSTSYDLQVYLDGTLYTVLGLDDATTALYNPEKLIFGRDIGDTSRDMFGRISEIRIYNKILEESEIRQFYADPEPSISIGTETQIDSEAKLPYWIENWDSANQQATIWVKVPSIPASGTATIYMYYGNPDATSESNGDEVFDFFDDFDGTELDTSKWSSDGTVSVSQGQLHLGSTTGDSYILSKINIGSGKIVELHGVNINSYRDTPDWFSIRFALDSSGNPVAGDSQWGVMAFWRVDERVHHLDSGGSVEFGTVSHTSNDIFAHAVVGTTAYVFANSNKFTTDTDSFTTNYFKIQAHYVAIDIDLIRVRKYTDPEPTYSIGEEEILNLISQCTVIDTPNLTYYLTQDITSTQGDSCINITASNVILECDGYSINGSETDSTIHISNADNVTVRNCVIYGGNIHSIMTLSSSNITLENITIVPESNYGIRIDSSNNVTIDNVSVINATPTYGIMLYSSDNVNVTNSVSNGATAIGLYYTSNSHISNSEFTGVTMCMYLQNSNNNIIHSSRFTECSRGIQIQIDTSEGNLFYNNFINATYDIYVEYAESSNTPKTNYWNTTKTSGTNIVGGNYIGGNFYAKPDGTGYSENCTDSDFDGFCDDPYQIDTNNIDYLPLYKVKAGPHIIGVEARDLVYSYGGSYQVNVTVCDDNSKLPDVNAIDHVIVEYEGVNSTASKLVDVNTTCAKYNVTFTGLPAGTYEITIYANNSYGNRDTAVGSFVINKATPHAAIYLRNETVVYGSSDWNSSWIYPDFDVDNLIPFTVYRNGELIENMSGLVARWSFDEGSGTTVKDRIGVNDGELKRNYFADVLHYNITWQGSDEFSSSSKGTAMPYSIVDVPDSSKYFLEVDFTINSIDDTYDANPDTALHRTGFKLSNGAWIYVSIYSENSSYGPNALYVWFFNSTGNKVQYKYWNVGQVSLGTKYKLELMYDRNSKTLNWYFNGYSGNLSTTDPEFDYDIDKITYGLEDANITYHNIEARDLTTNVIGKFGKALSFDGVDDYVEVPDSPNLDGMEQLTVTAWVKTTTLKYQYIVSKESYSLYLDDYTVYFKVVNENDSSQGLGITLDEGTDMVNNWYFFAGVYDGSKIKIYSNGKLEATHDFSGKVKDSATSLYIGKLYYGTRYFNGIIDEVRIYNRALTDEEIKQLYLYGLNKLAAGTYNYTLNVTETQNYTSTSISKILTINKATPVLAKQIPSNKTYDGVSSTANFSVSTLYNQVPCKLYLNGAEIGTTNTEISDSRAAAGIYSYVFNCSETQNYTYAEVSGVYEIYKATPTLTISLPDNKTYDGQAEIANFTIQTVNNQLQATLELNNNTIGTTTTTISDSRASAGVYCYNFYTNGNQNYTANSIQGCYEIYKATPVLNLYIDGAQLNKTITWMNTSTITANESNFGDGDVTYCLYRNETQIQCAVGFANITNATQLPSGLYVYTYNASGGQNYTVGEVKLYLTVKKAWNQTDNVWAGKQYMYDLNASGIPITISAVRSQDTSKVTESDGYAYCLLNITAYNNGSAYGVDPTTFTNIKVNVTELKPEGWETNVLNYTIPSLSDAESNKTYVPIKKYGVITDSLKSISALNGSVKVGEPLFVKFVFIVNNTDTIPYTGVLVNVSDEGIEKAWSSLLPVRYVDLNASEVKYLTYIVNKTTVYEVGYMLSRADTGYSRKYTYTATLNVTEDTVTKDLPIYYTIPTSRLTEWSSKTSVSVTVDGSDRDVVLQGNTVIIGTQHTSSSLHYGTHTVTIVYYVPVAAVGGGGGGGVSYIPATNETVYIANIEPEKDVPVLVVLMGDKVNVTILDVNNKTVLTKFVDGAEQVKLLPGNYTIIAEKHGITQKYDVEIKYPTMIEIGINEPQHKIGQIPVVESINKYFITAILIGLAITVIFFRDIIVDKVYEIWDRIRS
ncbi:MAG: hypothetical protein DRN30_01385 [Thermoplasmata archaeon]|nr:MAG: hypothetical protein DRN30_01385 [Thermoplasmata archaeon]